MILDTVQATAPVLHLRNLNPYVENALGEWQTQHNVAPVVPRALAPDSSLVTWSGVKVFSSIFMPPSSETCG